MFLSKFVLINYRSCRLVEMDLLKNEPNILIGINDCGKTTLLKGLELLLCDRPQIFCIKDGTKKKDASNSPLSVEEYNELFANLSLPAPKYTGEEIIVLGKFIVEQQDFEGSDVEELKPQSQWALESAIEEGLWFCRVFDIEGKVKHYLLQPDAVAEEGLHSFFHLTNTQLGKKRTEYALTADDINNSNGKGRFTNLEVVRSLYSKIGTTLFWVEWKWEKHLFPSFRYLDWNSSFDNILESAAEALKELIDDHLTPVRLKARENAEAAQRALNEHLRGHKDVIATLLPQVQDLTANIHFEVKEKITDLLITKLGGDGPVHMDLQGDGIKRQIWFALIKAAAISNEGLTQKKHIWAFDEPETHLYPTAQRQLFEIIKEITAGTIQSIISTHSTVFIDKAQLCAIRIVSQENSYTIHSSCHTIDDVFHSLELRNSDFLFYDKFLVVEGDTEEYLIPALYYLYRGCTLKEDNIQLVVLRSASNWLTQKHALENVFEGFKKSRDNVIYLFDNDQKFKIGAAAITDNMFFVGKQDIEDALPNEIWAAIASSVYEGKINFSVDDIQAIKNAVPSGEKAKANEKFLEILKKAIRERARDMELDVIATIPSKGYNLVSMILEQVTTIDMVPAHIVTCFERLYPSAKIIPLSSEGVEEEITA